MYSHQEYAALDEKLRRLGFENDQTSGIICRYQINGLVVDIVPTQSQALGFTNK
jgi:hypothetical protein